MPRYKQPIAVTLPRNQQPTKEQVEFMRRRLAGLLHDVGRYRLDHLLSEAYLQGMRDAVDAMTANPREAP